MGNALKMVGFLLVCCTKEQLEEKEKLENKDMPVYGWTPTMAVLLDGGVLFTVNSTDTNKKNASTSRSYGKSTETSTEA